MKSIGGMVVKVIAITIVVAALGWVGRMDAEYDLIRDMQEHCMNHQSDCKTAIDKVQSKGYEVIYNPANGLYVAESK